MTGSSLKLSSNRRVKAPEDEGRVGFWGGSAGDGKPLRAVGDRKGGERAERGNSGERSHIGIGKDIWVGGEDKTLWERMIRGMKW